ncbi:MAG: right-handed parallel beta-helix repeat-containing protein [Tannerella sp.]|jgi:hypothetical protein|nr:right-handed parallel beta-helix repeat-containing protein [Tannerella sp.]
MKRKLVYALHLFVLFILFAACKETSGRVYYISTEGSDLSDGTKNKPFGTFACATSILQPGDTLYIRGGWYEETLHLKRSGMKGSPVVISNYPGEDVYISGADKIVSTWKPTGNDVWVTDLPNDFSDTLTVQVFKNSKMLVEARWPNMPKDADMRMIGEYGPYRAIAQTGTDKDGIVCEKKFDDLLTGGGICIWPGANGVAAWEPSSRRIAGVNGNKLLFDKEMTSEFFDGMDPTTPYPGNPYFIFGSKCLLDNENEYYIDEKEKNLYLISKTDPANDIIRIKKRTTGIYIDSISYATIRGLTVYGANLYAGMLNQVNIEFCKFLYPEYLRFPGYYSRTSAGMFFSGENSDFRNNEIAYCSADGLTIKGSKLTIYNNYLHDVACTGLGAGIHIHKGCEYISLTHNSIIRSGRAHFVCSGGSFGEGENMFNEKYIRPAKVKKIIMEYNYLQDHNTYTSDCALFYAWNVDGEGTVFRYNYCIESLNETGDYKYTNGKMERQLQGIYSDNFCRNMEFSNNIVINATTGIQVNNFCANIRCFNNTIINPTGEMVATFGYLQTPGYMKDTRIYNNTFFTSDSSKNIYLARHCDRGAFENTRDVRQEYIKRVSFEGSKAVTKRYDLAALHKPVSANIGIETDTTFNIIFDHHDPELRNAASKGNRLHTSPNYGKPYFYENYFKLPNGEMLKNVGCNLIE